MKTWYTIAPSMLIGATGLIGSALAADMTGAEIKAFVSGKSIYLETTAASAAGTPGQGVVYLAEDGTGLYKTPTGTMWHGKWETKGNTFCADWRERPNNPCTRFDKTGDAITIIDAVSGQIRAKLVKTAPGNITPRSWLPDGTSAIAQSRGIASIISSSLGISGPAVVVLATRPISISVLCGLRGLSPCQSGALP